MSPVPDIAKEKLKSGLPVDLVGIRELKMPVKLNSQQQTTAQLSILVSLEDKNVRGIHMSRLYSILHDHFSKNTVHLFDLKKPLIEAIKSQEGIAANGRIRLEAEWPTIRKALKSPLSGWRVYPFFFEVNYFKKKGEVQYIAGGEVTYSSTCPCSVSLSHQIIKSDFEKTFAKKKSLKKEDIWKYLNSNKLLGATPHSQKSKAFFKVQLPEKSKNTFSFLKVIDSIEKALGTPVQTAVKREDEAEFAIQNAKNLMFCEDAVRKIAPLFKSDKNFLDYLIKVQHYESLHPFTVESSIAKGVKKGWRS